MSQYFEHNELWQKCNVFIGKLKAINVIGDLERLQLPVHWVVKRAAVVMVVGPTTNPPAQVQDLQYVAPSRANFAMFYLERGTSTFTRGHYQ